MAKAKSPGGKPTAKPKSKAGKNLLQMPESGNGGAPPYSPAELEVEIRLRAYELYQQRGYAPGQEAQDWLAAEQEVLARHDRSKHSA